MDQKKRHSYHINLRLTEAEFAAIRQHLEDDGATQTGRNFSAGVRRLLQNAVADDIQEQPRKPRIDAELAKNILGEVKRIGTNVNQLAKKMNGVFKKGETVSDATLTKLTSSLNLVSQHLDDILSRIHDLER